MNEMMHIDMMGGAGKESHENRDKLKFEGEPIDGIHLPEAADAGDAPAHGADSMENMPGMEATPGMATMPGMTMQHDGHTCRHLTRARLRRPNNSTWRFASKRHQ
jgi:cytochrome o ubiquinol oxidase subunit 2